MDFFGQYGSWLFWIVVILILLPGTIFTVQQQTAAVVQHHISHPNSGRD